MRLASSSLFRTAALAATAGLTILSAHAQQPTARQMQALKQACATGALSPDECKQRGVSSASDAAAGGQTSGAFADPAGAGGKGQLFRDPQNRYKLMVPAGWNVAVDNGNAEFNFDKAKVQTICGQGLNPKSTAEGIAQQYGKGFQDLKIFNQGPTKANGHDAWGINFDGTLKGVHYSMLVISISAGSNHYLTLVSYMPSAQAAAMNSQVIGMANSVQF